MHTQMHTTYLVWCPEDGETREDTRSIEAYDIEDAASTWAKHHDAQGDGLIAQGQPKEVIVALDKENSTEILVVVDGGYEPVYYTRVKERG